MEISFEESMRFPPVGFSIRESIQKLLLTAKNGHKQASVIHSYGCVAICPLEFHGTCKGCCQTGDPGIAGGNTLKSTCLSKAALAFLSI